MRVAVVIAARDIAGFVGVAIRSVLTQTHADLSLTVVDDGSVDSTRAIVGGFRDERLRLIGETGRGVSAARNRGAAEADADALLFLDGDDWLAPDALRLLVAALGRDDRAAAAHAPFAFVAEAAMPEAPGSLDRRAAPRGRDLLARLIPGNIFANGGHVLIGAAAWAAAGPFREDLAFAEDWEFWPRLALQGSFVAVRGEPLLFVRRRAGSLMHGKATQMASYRPTLAAIAGNGAIAERLGRRRFGRLLRRAETELAWTLGREVLRRGDAASAWPLLRRGLWGRFRPQRIALLALLATRR
jgi:hypothetical protein